MGHAHDNTEVTSAGTATSSPDRFAGAGRASLKALRRQQVVYAVIITVYLILFLACAVWSAIAFYGTTSQKGMILYSTIFVVSVVMCALLKLVYWVGSVRWSVLRELKLLQLQLADLASRCTR